MVDAEIWPWLNLAPLMPSVRDVWTSGRALALDADEMLEGLLSGTIVFRYVSNGWRAVYA